MGPSQGVREMFDPKALKAKIDELGREIKATGALVDVLIQLGKETQSFKIATLNREKASLEAELMNYRLRKMMRELEVLRGMQEQGENPPPVIFRS